MDLKCEIICVGTELLLGDIVNTNSHFITKSLAEIGIDVYYHTVVGDNFERLTLAMENSFNRGMNLIITSGGLGPTDDDITKECTSEYFNRKLVSHEESLKNIEKFVKSSRENLTEANLKQSYVPEESIVMKNSKGTAPGIIIENEDKIIINLPGPPSELYEMFNDSVKPYLEKKSGYKYYSEFLRLYGINEGDINGILSDLFNRSDQTLAPYVKEDDLVLRITTKCKDDDEGRRLISELKDEIYKRVGQFIYAEGESNIEELLCSELKKRNFRISFGESLTGGMLSSRFVNLSGASEFFGESFVTYSNESKMKNLFVKYETLEKFGAVSSNTAREMALGVLNKTGCHVSISTTWVAGPSESEGKKPGLVYIAVCVLGEVYVKELNIIGDRMRIRERTTFDALVFAYDILKNMEL